ncbi:ABC transporter permease [Paenibacillus montaniterrae]|uniref:ABC transporter permease n=1 Tax=Paenibacillus montaniterrae TaxID=429341 RepID=A0A920CZH1_9BACL|nr:sugar ABC transporter permease [Paenibacillus montaniterrae]GIP18876.1 ABC transporter permease [Paenibacillus montaniterrae]
MGKKRVSSVIRPYLMILPAMIGIGVFVIYPIFYLAYLSLHKYNLMNPAKSKFIGLDNYADLFARDEFYKVLGNTALYTFATVLITLVLSVAIAVWVSKNTKFNQFIQAGIFTPHIVSIVSIALVWMWMMEPSLGFLNYILKSVGLPTSQWLQSSSTAMASIIFVSVWQGIGYYVLIIVAALQGVSPSIYEAASLDNASKWKIFYKITLPMISPQLFFILIIMTIGSFKVFDTVRMMTLGGPNNSTNTLVYYIYQNRTTNIGYASATGMVLMLVIGILTFVYFRMLANKVHYQ